MRSHNVWVYRLDRRIFLQLLTSGSQLYCFCCGQFAETMKISPNIGFSLRKQWIAHIGAVIETFEIVHARAFEEVVREESSQKSDMENRLQYHASFRSYCTDMQACINLERSRMMHFESLIPRPWSAILEWPEALVEHHVELTATCHPCIQLMLNDLQLSNSLSF